MSEFQYVGSELELFANAVNWKSYFGNVVRRYLGAEVLEVGAGCGATTAVLCSPSVRNWVCLEPDRKLVDQIERAVSSGTLPPCCHGTVGFLNGSGLPPASFDTVLYIDVLEHIENDRDEVATALQYVRPGGHIVALCPAHQWLYSPFDSAIGHFRRYSKSMISALTPSGARVVALKYLDCVGLLASAANRLVLRQSQPTAKQIEMWDRRMVPISRRLDGWVGFLIGKSVLCVWQREH